MVGRASLLLAAWGLCACTSLSGLSAGVEAGADGSSAGDAALPDGTVDGALEDVSDASPLVDADAGPDAADPCAPDPTRTNLAPSGDFEASCGAPWFGYFATVVHDPTAHCGAFSCRVCKDPEAGAYTLDESPNFVGSPQQGQIYEAVAWVRAVPGATNPEDTYIHQRLWVGSGYTETQTTGPVTLTQTWQRLDVVHTVASPVATTLNIYVSVEQAVDGDCFLVDDVAIYRLQ